MASKYGVRGAPELAAKLRDIARTPTAAQRRRARAKALEPIRAIARERLAINESVETGALSAALDIQQDSRRPNRTVMGPRTGKVKGRIPSAYSHLVEFGTRPHFQPNRFGGIMHPGARPKPFMRFAAEAMATICPPIYAAEIIAEIQTAAATSAARAPRRRAGA